MSNLSLRLPDSLHSKLRELAKRDGVSINQLIATAVAEKAAALLTVDYLDARARHADTMLVDRILERVPDVPAIAGDERPNLRQRTTKTPKPKSRARAAGVRTKKRSRAVR
ncbi:MAG TPA: toxin-antitoxin system HicB family antitoxin [Vicinamibacterales bacterium]|jgi:predicted transcriptional regulator|nr:toxin-antitoxin system HicB family antitoxin [Vicinamibacterales bacterium]